MVKFLERHKLLKLTQGEIDNLSSSIISKEIKVVIQNVSTKKIPGPDAFTGEFFSTFKKGIATTLHKLLQETEEERKCFLTLSMKSPYPDTKTNKDITRK